MEDFNMLGRWLVMIGLSIAVIGGIVWLVGRLGGNFRFPGTLRIEGSGFTCIFPILGSIVLSIVLTVLLNLLMRLFNR